MTCHLYGGLAEVSLSHESLLVSDVEAFLSEGLDDSVVTQQRFSRVAPEDQTPSTAIQLRRKQQRHNGWLHMLLIILVSVEWILQIHRYTV